MLVDIKNVLISKEKPMKNKGKMIFNEIKLKIKDSKSNVNAFNEEMYFYNMEIFMKFPFAKYHCIENRQQHDQNCKTRIHIMQHTSIHMIRILNQIKNSNSNENFKN
ncbi:hypothetical protein BLOT_010992 [Blomia tropicalis]|nr:hypothetical protein BLOT_010992 [Blomia tropicalis]